MRLALIPNLHQPSSPSLESTPVVSTSLFNKLGTQTNLTQITSPVCKKLNTYREGETEIKLNDASSSLCQQVFSWKSLFGK